MTEAGVRVKAGRRSQRWAELWVCTDLLAVVKLMGELID